MMDFIWNAIDICIHNKNHPEKNARYKNTYLGNIKYWLLYIDIIINKNILSDNYFYSDFKRVEVVFFLK